MDNILSTRFQILLLLLLTLGFRIVHLQADPPADFSWSGGYFADEGFWAHNARNAALYGTAVRDEWDASVVSPIFATVQRFVFFAFGPGLVQVRLIGILSAIALSLTTFFIFHRYHDPAIAFLAASLTGICYPLLVLARQGILDPFGAALGWLALLSALSANRSAALLSGVLFMGALVTKYLMIYLAVPFSFILLQRDRTWKTLFLSGVAVVLLPWIFFNYLPHSDLLNGYSRYYSSQQSWQPAAVLKNVVTQPFYLYFSKTPVILFAGNIMLGYVLITWRHRSLLEKTFAVWLVCGLLFFALWRYRPLRYYTSLLPPLIGLGALAMVHLDALRNAFRTGSFRALLWLLLLLPFVQICFAALDKTVGWNLIPQQVGLNTIDLLLFIAITLYWAVYIYSPPYKTVTAIVVFACCFLLSDMRSYAAWISRPVYSAREVSRDLQKRVGNGVLTGQWAPEMCLENNLVNVPVWQGFVNSQQPFDRYGITHVLQWEYELGGEQFEIWYPQDFLRFEPIARYRVKNSDVILFQKKR